MKLLRRIALAARAPQPQIFYSLRQVAKNFNVPLSLVNRVFCVLEEEGLVGKVRGSRTVLYGRKYDRNLHLRGIVGLPVSMFRFSAIADYRTFITQIRRQLRRRGFMPAAIFYDRHEIQSDFLTRNLTEAKVDAVIWFSPDRHCRETCAMLRDQGVRVIGVSDTAFAPIPCRYQIRREKALRAILQAWRHSGITSTVVVSEPRYRSVVDEERCRASSEEEQLPSDTLILDKGELKATLAKLGRRENRGILLTGSAAAFFALREADALWWLMQRRRVASLEGPISVLFAHVPPVPVDMITVDWLSVASRIVEDLAAQAAWSKPESLLFHADVHLRVELDHFCHEF